MAKPTKHATLICIILTLLALLGIIIGVIKSNPLITIIFKHLSPNGIFLLYEITCPISVMSYITSKSKTLIENFSHFIHEFGIKRPDRFLFAKSQNLKKLINS